MYILYYNKVKTKNSMLEEKRINMKAESTHKIINNIRNITYDNKCKCIKLLY